MLMSALSPANLLPSVTHAVLSGAAMIRAAYHRAAAEGSAASWQADFGDCVEAMLRERLESLHPAGWSSSRTSEDIRAGRERWLVEVNDGGGQCCMGRRGSAISVALLREGRPVLGVVCAPTAPDDGGDVIAWADGTEVLRNGKPLDSVEAGTTPVASVGPEVADFGTGETLRLDRFRVLPVSALSYRLALAAIGEVQVGLSLDLAQPVTSVAAGHALIAATGGHVTDLEGRAIDYDRVTCCGVIGGARPFIASIFPQQVRVLRPSRPRRAARSRNPVAVAGLVDRAQGCLLGHLAGDALGSQVQTKRASEIASIHPDGVQDMADGGVWGTLAGQPTDDGEMALALSRALLEEQAWSKEAMSRAYIDWHRSGPFEIKGSAARGIYGLSVEARADCTTTSSAAMARIAPLGIFFAGLPSMAAEMARRDAALTHPALVCLNANAAYAAAISVAVAGAAPEEIWAAAMARLPSGQGGEQVQERLIRARDLPPSESRCSAGSVLPALQNAFYWLLSGATLEEALVRTASRGGDSGTMSAIAGGLVGAAQGRDAIPPRWRNAVLTARASAPAKVQRPRPPAYWPDDAMDLAEALLATGY